MKFKGLSICTILAVLLLAVSFSMPVLAVQTKIGTAPYETTLTGPTLYLSADGNLTYSVSGSGSGSVSGSGGNIHGNSSMNITSNPRYDGSSNTLSFDVEFAFRLLVQSWNGGQSYYIPAGADVLRIFSFLSLSDATTNTVSHGSGVVSLTPYAVYLTCFGSSYDCTGSGTSWYVDALHKLSTTSMSLNNTALSLHVKCTVSCRLSQDGASASDALMTINPKLSIALGTSEYTLLVHDFEGLDVSVDDVQNQTNTLTSGYDNSGLNQSNSNLSGAITDYDNTESQITDSSVANIDAVEFVSPSSNATLLSSISLTTSWLQSLYVNSGDWSLLVTISLSLSLGLMLIGWFKYR